MGIVIVWGIFVTVIWIVIGWRAMRAHEKIAENLERYIEERQDPPFNS